MNSIPDSAGRQELAELTESSCPEEPLEIANWYRRVYALCRAKLICAADAEDATQETFRRACVQRDQLTKLDNLGGWLRAVAHNVCVDLIRRNAIRRSAPESLDWIAASSPPPERRKEDSDELIEMIGQLPEPLREVILLHYYDDMTYDQMAAWLDVARSTVNDRLSRARCLLKKKLIAKGDLE